MGIGVNLKKLLKEKKMSVQELSKISGISANTLYGIIKRDNNTLQPDILEKLVIGIGTTKDRILGWDVYQDRIDALKKPISEASRKIMQQDEDMEKLFYMLNGIGRMEALKRVYELTQLDQYRIKDEELLKEYHLEKREWMP